MGLGRASARGGWEGGGGGGARARRHGSAGVASVEATGSVSGAAAPLPPQRHHPRTLPVHEFTMIGGGGPAAARAGAARGARAAGRAGRARARAPAQGPRTPVGIAIRVLRVKFRSRPTSPRRELGTQFELRFVKGWIQCASARIAGRRPNKNRGRTTSRAPSALAGHFYHRDRLLLTLITRRKRRALPNVHATRPSLVDFAPALCHPRHPRLRPRRYYG